MTADPTTRRLIAAVLREVSDYPNQCGVALEAAVDAYRNAHRCHHCNGLGKVRVAGYEARYSSCRDCAGTGVTL